MSIYIEFVAIITSRVLYLAFRQHRFVINFGYGFDSSDSNMTTVTILIVSAFVELIFEGFVDAFALDVEWRSGINVDDFWTMWGANAAAFWTLAIVDGAHSIQSVIW